MATSAGSIVVDLDANSVKLLRELQKAKRKTSSASQSMRRSMQQAFAGIKSAARVATTALAGAAVAMAAMTGASLRAADKLGKTASKLGIATDQLAALHHAAELTGVSIETMNMGLQRMVRRIAEAAVGTGEAKGALKELGLNAKDLAAQSMDEQFKQVAEALEQVDSQGHKVRLTMKLFDSEGVALVNTMKGGREALTEYAKEAERLGLALTNVETGKMEAASDAILTAKRAITGIGNSLAIAVAPLLTKVANKFSTIAGETRGFRDEIHDYFRTAVGGAGSLIDSLRSVRSAWDGIKVSTQGALAVWQQARVADLKMGEAYIKGKAGFLPGGRNAEQRASIKAQVDEAVRLRQEAESALAQTIASIESAKQRIIDAADAPDEYRARFLAAFDAADLVPAVARVRTGVTTELTAIDRAMAELGVDTPAALASLSEKFRNQTMTAEENYAALKKVLDVLLKLGPAANGISLETYNRAMAAGLEELHSGLEEIDLNSLPKLKTTAKQTFKEMDEYSKQAARNMQDAFAEFLFDPFERGLKGMLQGFIDIMRRMLANQISSSIFSSLNLFGGGRAAGGPVSAGTPYLVGERGPELFMPGASGMIIPNHQLASGGNVFNFTNNVTSNGNMDAATMIPILDENNRKVKAEFLNELSRGKYD